MTLAEDLALAATTAALQRNETQERERKKLDELRHRLEQELAADQDEVSLEGREAALSQEIETIKAEVARLREHAAQQHRDLEELLTKVAANLHQRNLRLEKETGGKRLAGCLLSALEAFGFDHAEATPAQILASLPGLIQQAAKVRRGVAQRARQLSKRFEEEGERIGNWRLLEEEEASLRSREQELLDALRIHGREEGGIPPLVCSLADADLRTLRLFRERVLDALLADLAAEEEHWRPMNGTDPLGELASRLRAVPP